MINSNHIEAFEKIMSGSIGGVDILVIEDNVDHLRLLKNILEHSGYHVRPARNGKAGLRAAKMMRPDLILLDVKLPDCDGFEWCQDMNLTPELQRVPVIFISGLSDTPNQVLAFQAGGRDFITKPFEEAVVIARIRNQLAIQQLQREREEYSRLLERNRIARELHDSVKQMLFLIGSHAEAISLTETDISPSLANKLADIHRLSQSALEEMHTMLLELRSETIQNTTAETLVSNIVRSLQIRTDAQISVIFKDNEGQLKDITNTDMKVAIYHITREALFNAVKHANAAHINVAISDSFRGGRVLVEDDGIGFSKSILSQSGMGLSTMQERALHNNIELNIESILGTGTKISMQWEYKNSHARKNYGLNC